MSTRGQQLSVMKIKIPHELKLKFISLEGLSITQTPIQVAPFGSSFKSYIPGKEEIDLELDLSDDPELLECCREWMRTLETYFKTSYRACRLDIGPYEGLWPREIVDGVVRFNVDTFYPERKDWKDWFIQEDHEYAPK